MLVVNIMKIKIYLLLILLLFSILIIVLTSKFTQKNEIVASTYYDNSVSSIVMDQRTKRILYENNSNKRMLPASTTKILTCIVAIENYDLDSLVIIKKEMLQVEGSSIYLEVGDVITVRDLLYGLMLRSGNDAAMALAYHYSGEYSDFIYLMNEKAKELKMTSSTFENPHGLDSDSKNYTTVHDMALLMSYALNNHVFREITSCKSYNPTILTGKKMYFNNKHKLILSNELVTGGKTGVVPIFCVI